MENFEVVNRLEIILREIKVDLSNGAFFSALSLALIVPDICGQLLYPEEKNTKEKTKRQYIKWFDENVYDCMGIKYSDAFRFHDAVSSLNGNIVYALRNKILHEGHDDISERTDIGEFVLVFNNEKFVRGTYAGLEPDFEQGSKLKEAPLVYPTKKYLYVGVGELANNIMQAGNLFLNEHGKEFESTLLKLKINHGGGKIKKDLFI